ncbi:NADH-quinone oxidoreductase subunit G [Candidatus Hepatincolaceae symbiont of Richtersius coronifer]
MPKIVVNGVSHTVEDGLTLIQVCDSLGLQIPRFCYHEKLPPVGSCRMCLIELKNSKKLVPSCTTQVAEGMEFATESSTIDVARKSMLEMLLVNHPLDCPICDAAGECDLQDQTYRYGLDRSYIEVPKRSVENKDFGPLIDPYMTRCIHCTRCIRFAVEIAGVEDLGGIGRGDLTEVTTYVGKAINSELSGNLADICPVGALTNAAYAYKARPWELRSVETIDIMDAVGSNIKVDCSPLVALRILPRLNEDINEEWIADKSRYIVDALRVQRLDSPMIRINGRLQKVSWDLAFKEIANRLSTVKPEEIAALAGQFSDAESMMALKDLIKGLGSDNIDCRPANVFFDPKDRNNYLFNTTITGIEEADICLIIASNPRIEAPILNARIRKRYLRGGFKIGVVGEQQSLNYKYDYLGNTLEVLQEILQGDHHFAKALSSAKKPMMIIGMGTYVGQDYEYVNHLCKQIAVKYNISTDVWNGYNILNTSTSVITGLEVGFVPNNPKNNIINLLEKIEPKVGFLWLLNEDNINFANIKNNTFIVYQGHHGDQGASHADVVLPGALWLEKTSTYVNIEGRAQRAIKAIPTLGEAREDWKIIRKFSEYVANKQEYDTIEELQQKLAIFNPIFANLGEVSSINKKIELTSSNRGEPREKSYKTLKSVIDNYYISDVISRNSEKMAECSKVFHNKPLGE